MDKQHSNVYLANYICSKETNGKKKMFVCCFHHKFIKLNYMINQRKKMTQTKQRINLHLDILVTGQQKMVTVYKKKRK